MGQKKGYRNVIITHTIYVLNMGKFYLCRSKIQLVIFDLKVAMLYFEQLLVAKVIYDVINYMNKYLMTYVNNDVDVCNIRYENWCTSELMLKTYVDLHIQGETPFTF